MVHHPAEGDEHDRNTAVAPDPATAMMRARLKAAPTLFVGEGLSSDIHDDREARS
jgi:hypothetical protein